MSMRYIGGVISATRPTVSSSSASGIWSLETQAQAETVGKWPEPPGPTFKVYVWGFNYNGALGVGNTTNYSSPVQLGALTTWSQVATGGNSYSTLGIISGALYAWGYNLKGQLGVGNTTSYSSPVQVGALTTWKHIANNQGMSAAIKKDGTLWTWGDNSAGQLGVGDTTNRSSPVQVGALTDWASVAVGGGKSCVAIKFDGSLYAWGQNSSGELGVGNTTNYSSPVQVGALTNWLSVACTYYSVLAKKTDGTLWAWGGNSLGQVGDSTNTNRSSPVQIGSDTDWAQISGGDNFHAAIKTNGTSWAWGQNSNGKLGDGSTTNRNSPVQIGALTNWSISAAAGGATYWVKTDGTLWSVGRGAFGTLGVGNTTDYSSPVQVGALTTWADVKGGGNSARAFTP